MLRASNSLQPGHSPHLRQTTRSAPAHAGHPLRQQLAGAVRSALGLPAAAPASGIAAPLEGSARLEAATSALTAASSHGQEAWRRVWALSRACAAHGMEEEALVVARWAASVRGGVAAVEEVEAAAIALGSLSVKLPAPRRSGRTRSHKLWERRQGVLASLDEAAAAAAAPFAAVGSAKDVTRMSWPKGVAVPTARVGSRLHWVWELLVAARLAEQEAAAVRRCAAGAAEAPRSAAGVAVAACPVPGRTVALCARILLPTAPSACTADEAVWGAAMAQQLLCQWLDAAAPGSSARLFAPAGSAGVAAEPVSPEAAGALLARGAAAALEAVACALLGAGQAEAGMRAVRAQVALATAAAPAAGGRARPGGRSRGPAADSGMPSSGLFARVLGAASAASAASVSATLEALFASGRPATMAVFREVARALLESTEQEGHAEEPSVLQALTRAGEVLGRPVPPTLLGWAAFYAAERGWWAQVAAIRARTERDHPGVWESSAWAARVQTMTQSLRERA